MHNNIPSKQTRLLFVCIKFSLNLMCISLFQKKNTHEKTKNLLSYVLFLREREKANGEKTSSVNTRIHNEITDSNHL